ncbi:argonaute-like protein [Epithele typhae]|uniref:argonaute-like protein n=1 Tax=Epithele typhae TaxID=378194 RepID=UPI00200748C1|nr:argonaute-like protein [Epithele typhae]KAH9943477.1 argonaute-like protein [Epithele typhae]
MPPRAALVALLAVAVLLVLDIAPDIFTPRAVYDGRKNLFAARELPFGPSGTHEFSFTLVDRPQAAGEATGKGPKPYRVKLTLVATINPEILARFLQGQQSHDNTVLTAITALNVVIRMEPSMKYPFNVRSFFTKQEMKNIGGGIHLWRGYFQSVRPAIGKMLINVDISTGAMYMPGPLISVALEFLNKIPGQQTVARTPRVVKKLTSLGADRESFTDSDGRRVSVSAYFKQHHNYTLRYPDIICAEFANDVYVPLELCSVPEGQIMRKQIPSEKTKDVLEFATQQPAQRLRSITNALGVLAYGQSEYVRQFGMHVANPRPATIPARILDTPTLQYGPGSKQPTIRPRDGAWNMIDKKLYRTNPIGMWAIVIYEREQRFTPQIAQEMVAGFCSAFAAMGITLQQPRPVIKYFQSINKVAEQLRAAGTECFQTYKKYPDLMIVVLPESSVDLYTAVKHFGDCTQGVATQCVKSSKSSRAKPQYFANVCLKINVKLGGINAIPDPRSVSVLTDPHNPTMVMGADVIHPAPGADGRPSFTALVGNVDSDTAKYVADMRVQTSRQEMIDDLKDMATKIILMYRGYRAKAEKKPGIAPKRIIFYRDGVSEGQFQHVLDYELPQLKEACKAAGVDPLPKITIIVVGKRHHVRFFPTRDSDRSGNCPAGTVVDNNITHPTEFDFYLQSHGGLLGTSRPAHYSVLYDENGFTPDSLQALSFALCHVYARSTRSVSIPAPVYYADTVCSRAKNHYDPNGTQQLSGDDWASTDTRDAASQLEQFRASFKPLHEKTSRLMYFC